MASGSTEPTSSWSWATRLVVLSAAAAIAVSVIYLPQSLLTSMAASLGVEPGIASLIATAVQTGYAIGIFFLVPLADRFQPRRQITLQVILLSLALLVSAVMPEVISVAIGFLIVGLVANIAQLIIPTAGALAPAGKRGSTTSSLVGSILIGIFGGRVVASLLVESIGWRWVVVIFAVLVIATLPFLRRALVGDIPLSGRDTRYGALLVSTLGQVRSNPILMQSAVLQFFVFATFNSVWTVVVLHLTAAPFNWSVLQAGLFGLVGLAAGIVTPFGGRFIDRFGAMRVNGVFLALMLVAAGAIVLDSGQLWWFGITLFVLTWANQTVQSSTQSRVLSSNKRGAAQANTIFMVGVFLGGSAGAFLGPIAFAAGGMRQVAVQAVIFVLLASLVWFISYRYERRHSRAL
ncbi:MAG: transporter [Glaciihabitans sp.]|nr:transporter [Glaciihabitans sp.]